MTFPYVIDLYPHALSDAIGKDDAAVEIDDRSMPFRRDQHIAFARICQHRTDPPYARNRRFHSSIGVHVEFVVFDEACDRDELPLGSLHHGKVHAGRIVHSRKIEVWHEETPRYATEFGVHCRMHLGFSYAEPEPLIPRCSMGAGHFDDGTEILALWIPRPLDERIGIPAQGCIQRINIAINFVDTSMSTGCDALGFI